MAISLAAYLALGTVTLAGVALVMWFTFLWGRKTCKYSVIDAVWGPGFSVIALVAYAFSAAWRRELMWDQGIPLVLVLLASLWGWRLGIHLHKRNHPLPEDPRYVTMLGAAPSAAFVVRRVHFPQGVIMWFVSLPVQAGIVMGGSWSIVSVLGLLVFMIGFGFEAVGDYQLAKFKQDPRNRGRLMTQGLWSWTRHPNYFGDSAIWWGLFLISMSYPWNVTTVLSPLVMTFFLVRVTGKVLTEKRLSASKAGYSEYVARTSGFFPRPPRKVATKSN